MSHIAFGTSGWRGILCEDFTFENVKVVTQAIADHLRAQDEGAQGIVLGYDARFMGKRFAQVSASVLAASQIPSFLCQRDTPTPVIAHEIQRRKAAGAINFTASHNPCEYNGLKFSPSSAGPALPDTTRDIENRSNALMGERSYAELPFDQALEQGLVEEIDPREDYFRRVSDLIDFAAIARTGKKLAYNPLYGTGRGYVDELLRRNGIETICINDHPDPYFGGFPPEPAEANIQDFISLVAEGDFLLGLATDGDADRYGILDSDGSYIEPNYILAMLYDYLIRVKGQRGPASRSVATSHFIDAVARYHGEEVLETPVGFKFIGEYIIEDRIVIGGEESAGLTVRGHVPDKDGILACLLVAEMVAVEGKSLKVLLQELYGRVGAFYARRDSIRLTPTLEAALSDKLASPPSQIAGRPIDKVVTIDGNKYCFDDGSWLLFRKSGTEPVVRLYGEASTPGVLDELMAAGRAFLLG